MNRYGPATAAQRRAGGQSPRAVRLLQSLESRLIALDESLLLATAGHVSLALVELPTPGPRQNVVPFRADQRRRQDRRLQFTPVPSQVDRVVIQNWNPYPGSIPIGDVELELEPGQAVTLWVGRGDPTPAARETERDTPGSLYILSDDQGSII